MTFAQPLPTEIHGRIARNERPSNRIALTLDACSGRCDEDLILFLLRNRIPATLLVTKKWLDRNARGP
jgi:peptidoglycan/xylan/chitin deacetylase (PgdA/CDA1 family)